MIILENIRCKYWQSVQVELPRANMVIDPRPNHPRHCPRFRCDYHDNGTTVTLTRTGEGRCSRRFSFPLSLSLTRTDKNYDYNGPFSFRVYDPATETVPSFDSAIYTYLGEDGERAPYDTTVLIIHPSVRVIKNNAFLCCKKIKKCYMHHGVHTIEERAFYNCYAMKTIRLSRSLTHIGEYAFFQCHSLEAVFLPPSVNQIDEGAFTFCFRLRILPLPPNIDISRIKGCIVDCYYFFKPALIQEYFGVGFYDNHIDRVHQDIIHFYRDHVPPLHKVCLRTHVTHQTIQQCVNIHGRDTASIPDHDGMTPLHILAMNPHADISALRACFDLNMESVFVEDSRGNTPLDYLRVHHDGIEDHTSLVSSLCMHRYAAWSS